MNFPAGFFKKGTKNSTPTATRPVRMRLPGVPKEADFLILLPACPGGTLRRMVETVDTVMIRRSK